MIVLKKIWYFHGVWWEIFTRLFQDHCRKNIFDVPNLGVWAIKKIIPAVLLLFIFLCVLPGENVKILHENVL
jgi:hypothetical protein